MRTKTCVPSGYFCVEVIFDLRIFLSGICDCCSDDFVPKLCEFILDINIRICVR